MKLIKSEIIERTFKSEEEKEQIRVKRLEKESKKVKSLDLRIIPNKYDYEIIQLCNDIHCKLIVIDLSIEREVDVRIVRLFKREAMLDKLKLSYPKRKTKVQDIKRVIINFDVPKKKKSKESIEKKESSIISDINIFKKKFQRLVELLDSNGMVGEIIYRQELSPSSGKYYIVDLNSRGKGSLKGIHRFRIYINEKRCDYYYNDGNKFKFVCTVKLLRELFSNE